VLPTFFIIGATKAGTTSLSNYLARHPEIHMSPIKEPHFFVQPGDGLPYVRDRVATNEEYEKLFATSLEVRGEASTSYSHYPARGGVPERISSRIPNAKIIYLVRDPIDRLVSHYRHQMAFEGERRPLEIAVGDLTDPYNIYVCAGRYGTQLQRYLRVFPAERTLVIDQADLRQQRDRTLAEIFEFLAVGTDYKSPEFQKEFGSSEQRRRYPTWYGVLRGGRRARAIRRYLPARLRGGLRPFVERMERAMWRELDMPSMPAGLHRELVRIFAPEAEELRSLTAKSFQTWSL
jgi:hypothetical protein